MNRIILYCLLLSLITACTKTSSESLSDYSSEFSLSISDELVACASSYLVFGEPMPENKTAVYYKTLDGQQNLRLWHANEFSQNLDSYTPIELSSEPLFEGFMGLFISELVEGAFIVSVETDSAIIHSKPIEVLTNTMNTVIDVDISINTDQPLQPSFNWPNSTIDPTSIYFHLIADPIQNQAISGTYTFENTFQFYELDNVVFNVTETENPYLEANTEYLIQIMDVSDNNWVTKIRREFFTTN